jgi:DNA-binding transcriptional regulator YiaG
MIRKFEQEAIVNQIMEGVHEKVDKQITKAEKSTDFKAIKKLADKVQECYREREKVSNKLHTMESACNEAIRNYNSMSQEALYGVQSFTYSNKELSWFKHDWQTRDRISDKLAIALLEPMAQERIKDIIMSIADEVSK